MTSPIAALNTLKRVQDAIVQGTVIVDADTQKAIAQTLHEAGQSELRYFDVQLPGYAAGEETNDDLSIWVAAPSALVVASFLPPGCEVVSLSQDPEPVDVIFILPSGGEALREAALRICLQDVPRDGVTEALENVTAALENTLLHLGGLMTPGDRAERTRLLDEARAAATKHLQTRARIRAHDDKLNAAERAPTGDDYNTLFSALEL